MTRRSSLIAPVGGSLFFICKRILSQSMAICR
nr:MAG TPA: hypothetical protein [Bacteriophage sp.]